MSTQAVIGIVVIVVLLLALVVGSGIVLRRRRQISLSPRDTPAVDGHRQVDKSGGYQADTGFSFSQGGTATAEPEPVADEAERILAGASSDIVEPVADDPIAQLPGTENDTVDEAMSVEAAGEAAETATPAPAEPLTPQLDEIEPTAGRLSRLRGRLSRSQGALGGSMLGLLGAGDLDEDSWEEIEDTLVMADLGTAATEAVVTSLRAELATGNDRSADDARAALRRVLVEQLHPELDRSVKALPHAGGPAVVLVVGVNGVGKTTTIGKVSALQAQAGVSVLMAAGDTFRAAAA
ncbi:MAG: signal recognition particle receptor subunit alpha, partial [Gordonia sp. (in: high G+C Gram-positive bacteria)]|uniref:signal recognition particle receptor subunit alpha n=1 Tax=Gordonia sp. (in: high G+C Gram-positive bacteria) TaxID=84139 RepID=UPI003BB570C0